MNPPTEYRRRLPHIQPEQAVFFITFRLAGTIPTAIMETLHNDYEKAVQTNENLHIKILKAKQDYFEQIENVLDSTEFGPTWLKNPDIARVVSESIHFYDQKMYKLWCAIAS